MFYYYELLMKTKGLNPENHLWKELTVSLCALKKKFHIKKNEDTLRNNFFLKIKVTSKSAIVMKILY